MTDQPLADGHGGDDEERFLSASREVAAPAARIFELIAEPTNQPRWDGNHNLAQAQPGQRVRARGDVFTMRTTKGKLKENHVVAFEEGRRIGWKPADAGQDPPGHVWGWELVPVDGTRTRVTHTYDWTGLRDERKFASARAMTAERLHASLERLASLAEQG